MLNKTFDGNQNSSSQFNKDRISNFHIRVF